MGIKKSLNKVFRKIIIFAAVISVAGSFSVFGSVLTSNTANAATTGDIRKDIVAYQYYKTLFVDNECGLKNDVKGDDIGKFNFYNVYGTSYFYVGKIAAPSEGGYNCGDTSKTSEFTKAAASALGLESSDPGELLCQLGYKQTVASSNATKTSCATGSTSIGGTDSFHQDGANVNVKKYLLANSLKNKEPKLTDAMAYFQTLQDFVLGCKAKVASSGSYGGGVVNIKTVNSSGNIVTTGYTYSTGDNKPFSAVNDLTNQGGGQSCQAIVSGLQSAPAKYVNAYQSYLFEQACSQKYSSSDEASACAAGTKNKSDINYCANAYSGASKKTLRLACYVGQGNEGADACVANVNNNNLAACIKGSQNSSNSDYCYTNYPAPDNLNSSGNAGNDANKANRDACIIGQASPAQGGGLKVSTTEVSSEDTDTGSSCVIPGVGWIICPVVSFIADIADSAFVFVGDNFLQIKVDVLNSDSGTYEAWVVMRNIANIAFVIAFLFIIFSQLTGQGVSNYGIKKTLPRLIIAAILVNTSYYVCQVAVDLSNILGYSLKNVFESVGGGIATGGSTPTGDQSGNWAGIAAAVIGGVGVAWALGLSVLLPFLLVFVIAILAVFVTLVLRQVLVILLIVIAPFAFVAYLLPNTEQWFTKWRKAFVALLVVFPVIGLLLGASGLASKILISVYGDTDNIVGKVVGYAVPGIALLFAYGIIRKSLDGVGGIGSKINGISDKVGNKSRSGLANSGVMKSLARQKQNKRAAIGAGIYEGRNPLSRLRSNANGRLNRSKAYNAVTGNYGTIRGANIDRLEGEENKLAESAVQLEARSGKSVEDQFASAIIGGDLVRAKAAENILMRQGGSGVDSVRRTIVTHEGKMSASMRTGLKSNIAQNHGQAAKQKGADVLKWSTLNDDSTSLSDTGKANSTWSGQSAKDLADQSGTAFELAMKSGGVGAQTMAALNDSRMHENLTESKRKAMGSGVYVAPGTASSTASIATSSTAPTAQVTVPLSGAAASAAAAGIPFRGSTTAAPAAQIDPAWQDWHRQQGSAQTVINVDHSGEAAAGASPQPQSARESQEQARASTVAEARRQASAAGNQGNPTVDSSGHQSPSGASDDYQDRMSR